MWIHKMKMRIYNVCVHLAWEVFLTYINSFHLALGPSDRIDMHIRYDPIHFYWTCGILECCAVTVCLWCASLIRQAHIGTCQHHCRGGLLLAHQHFASPHFLEQLYEIEAALQGAGRRGRKEERSSFVAASGKWGDDKTAFEEKYIHYVY